MESVSDAIRLCVVIAFVSQSASCHGDASQETARVTHSPCPVDSAATTLVRRVRAVNAPIELRLPAGVNPRESRDPTHRVHGWADAAGLTVSYAVHTETIPMPAPLPGDGPVIDCSEDIGGKAADIRLLYSEQTTAPGQYVVARWVLGSGETLVLMATHPDSSRKGELLSIVRSVRFDPIR